MSHDSYLLQALTWLNLRSTSRNSRRPRLSDLEVEPGIAQHLPNEVIIKCLESLTSEGYPWISSDRDRSWFRVAGEVPMFYPCAHYKSLVNATLVCKSWSGPGASVLYRTIFLTSPQRVRLLHKTLAATPSFGKLVQEIFSYQCFPLDRTWSQRRRGIQTSAQLTSELSDILRWCFPVAGFTLMSGYYHSHPSFVWGERFLSQVPIGSHLRHLTISTGSRPRHQLEGLQVATGLLSPEMSFPALESLILFRIEFYHELIFPNFPSLRTMTLCDLSFRHAFAFVPSINIPSAKFPRLEELKAIDVGIRIETDEQCLKNLKRLHLSGLGALTSFTNQTSSALMGSVKYLRIDPAKDLEAPVFIDYPENIERLDLVFSFQWMDLPIEPPSPQIFRDILLQTGGYQMLKELNIHYTAKEVGDLSPLREVLATLEETSATRGIELSVEFVEEPDDGWAAFLGLESISKSRRYYESVLSQVEPLPTLGLIYHSVPFLQNYGCIMKGSRSSNIIKCIPFQGPVVVVRCAQLARELKRMILCIPFGVIMT